MKRMIITLCGSTRFENEFHEWNEELTMHGNIVLSYGVFNAGEAHKPMLDEIHKQKIDMSDAIFVLNVGGYIGESTISEIEYAKSKEKPVQYLEQQE